MYWCFQCYACLRTSPARCSNLKREKGGWWAGTTARGFGATQEDKVVYSVGTAIKSVELCIPPVRINQWRMKYCISFHMCIPSTCQCFWLKLCTCFFYAGCFFASTSGIKDLIRKTESAKCCALNLQLWITFCIVKVQFKSCWTKLSISKRRLNKA